MNLSWSSLEFYWLSTSYTGSLLYYSTIFPSSLLKKRFPYNSYLNVWRATHAQKKSALRPLLHLLPFLFPTLLQIAWLSHPQYHSSYIMKSAAFIPFLCAWGLQFAHQVGRMILAHVTNTPFPVWDWIWVWNFLGALDANMPLLGR